MAYPHKLLKITFGGKLYNEEIWSNSLHMGHPTDDFDWGIFKSQNFAETLAGEVLAWFVHPNSGISSSASLEFVKFAVIGADGKYVEDPQIVDFQENNTGTNPGSTVAPQLTAVITFTTDAMRGLARVGRIYPPLNVPALNGNGRLNDTLSQADAAKKLVESLNYKTGSLWLTGVAPSVVVASNVREGKINYVTGVRVGNVIDTQRSRRNNFREDFSSLTVNPNPLTDPTP